MNARLERVSHVHAVAPGTAVVLFDHPHDDAAIVDIARQVEGLNQVLLVGQILDKEAQAPILTGSKPRGGGVKDRIAVFHRGRGLQQVEKTG